MNKTTLFIAILTSAAVIVSISGFRLLQPSEVKLPSGNSARLRPAPSVAADLSPTRLRDQLLQVGLNLQSVLSDLGVEEHLNRLKAGTVSKADLLRYAEDLSFLNRKTSEFGQQIPTSFWDVETPALKQAGWTPYRLVDHLARDAANPYLKVLAQCLQRFVSFKQANGGANDTALDTALDILPIVKAYVESLKPEQWVQHSPHIKSYTDATIMAWQTIISGTHRRNPLTHKPVFTHGFVARFNVSTMYQYHVGRGMNISEAWGVTGFANKYVGPPNNANQIEHMSISILLQAVFDEPVAVLNGIEEAQLLSGSEDPAEAHADMALNQAVQQTFLPKVDENILRAAADLRQALKSGVARK